MLAMTESNCRVPGTEPLTSGISVGVLVHVYLFLRLPPVRPLLWERGRPAGHTSSGKNVHSKPSLCVWMEIREQVCS